MHLAVFDKTAVALLLLHDCGSDKSAAVVKVAVAHRGGRVGGVLAWVATWGGLCPALVPPKQKVSLSPLSLHSHSSKCVCTVLCR